MRRVREKDRGFTLLEVLIAVLILGIIATAAIPLLSDYGEQARDARMVANVQALDRAVQRYELDHQAPWGFVYEPLSEDLYIPYNWEGGLGFVEQLEQPTDAYGNVLDDPGSSVTGPCVHGPYVSDAFAPATLLLGAMEGNTSFVPNADGIIAIFGRSVPKGCEIAWDEGVPVKDRGGDFLFMTPAGLGHRQLAGQHAKGALFFYSDLAFKHGYRIIPKVKRHELEEERRRDREGQIAKLWPVLAGPRLSEEDQNKIILATGDLVEQLRDAPGGAERRKIVKELKDFVARVKKVYPDLPQEMIGRVVTRIKQWPPDRVEGEEQRILGGVMGLLVLGKDNDVDLAHEWVRALKGEDKAKSWREELELGPIGVIGDEEVGRRARLFTGLAYRSDDERKDEGIDFFVHEVIDRDVSQGGHTTDDEAEFLNVRRRKTADDAFKKLKQDVGTGDPAKLPVLLGEYFRKIKDGPEIVRLRGRLDGKPVRDIVPELDRSSSMLRDAHGAQLALDYDEVMVQPFANAWAREAALKSTIKPKSNDRGEEISRVAKRRHDHVKVKVGVVVKEEPSTNRDDECHPETSHYPITQEGIEAERAGRHIRTAQAY